MAERGIDISHEGIVTFAQYRDFFGQFQSGYLGLAEVGKALSAALGRSVETLWQMRNGYALCHQTGLEAISAHVAELGRTMWMRCAQDCG